MKKASWIIYARKAVFLTLFTVVALQAITVEVSFGEFVDKITILEIKSEKIQDSAKLRNVATELNILMSLYQELSLMIPSTECLEKLKTELKLINETLWDIEDAIRLKEAKQEFDDAFIDLARSVYITNDKRFQLKRKIDLLLGSRLMEEKLLPNY